MDYFKKALESRDAENAALELSSLPIQFNKVFINSNDPFTLFTTKRQVPQSDELFHEESKLNQKSILDVAGSTSMFYGGSFLRATSPTVSVFPSAHIVRLPNPPHLKRNLFEVLESRRSSRRYKIVGLTPKKLSAFLHFSAGVNALKKYNIGGKEMTQLFRAYPSGGGLYPIDLYLLFPKATANVERGLYFYNAYENTLSLVRKLNKAELKKAEIIFIPAINEAIDIPKAIIIIFLVGNMWKSKLKYGVRGYRYMLQESGHIAQNLNLVSEAMDFGSCDIGGFLDDSTNEFLGLDGVSEACLYVITVGGKHDN